MYVKVHHVVINIFHISVGSNVVCSTIPGNAKASSCGTDDKGVPTLELSFVLYSTDNQCSIVVDQKGCSQMFPVLI